MRVSRIAVVTAKADALWDRRIIASWVLAALGGWVGNSVAGESSSSSGASLRYKYDDNIRVAADNAISLQGWIASGFVEGRFRTGRLDASADLTLEFERYTDASLDSDSPELLNPRASDFDSDNQDLKGRVAHQWQRHELSLSARYWRDSTLNTDFYEAGSPACPADIACRELEGATRRVEGSVSPGWQWSVTERQKLHTVLAAQQVVYDAQAWIDYDYAALSMTWRYLLTERLQVQAVPSFSWYDNDPDPVEQGDLASVTSRTAGLQAGLLWSMTELWALNLLLGSTHVMTEYGENVVQPIEDEDSNNFTGDITLALSEEYYGLNVGLSSRVSPSGNGRLQQYSEGTFQFFGEPLERLRVNGDILLGYNRSTDSRVEDGRIYRQYSVALNYRLVRDWWVSGRYRFRDQAYEATAENGRGNALYVTLSYRMPREIL